MESKELANENPEDCATAGRDFGDSFFVLRVPWWRWWWSWPWMAPQHCRGTLTR